MKSSSWPRLLSLEIPEVLLALPRLTVTLNVCLKVINDAFTARLYGLGCHLND